MASDANVRVLVSALTEAAEESLEDVGAELSGLAGQGHVAAEGLDAAAGEMGSATRTAAILQAALDELGSEAVSAGVKAEFLQHALDDVGDEATQAAVQSQAASGSFSSLSLSASGASLSVGTLSTAFTLSLIPALLTAATVIAPLVVAFGALAAAAAAVAGAFGLIIGSGILAWGDQMAQQNEEELAQTDRLISQYETMQDAQGALTAQQQTRLRQLREKKEELQDQTTATGALAGVVGDLKEELQPLVVEFGREFIPLIKDAVDAIPDVVEEMLNAVGGTEQFRDSLREFGQIAADVLPTLVGLMFDLARAALPVLRDVVSFLQDNGRAALEDMKASVMELKPELMDLLDALVDLAPTLLEFGTNVGNVLIPAVTKLVRATDGFMETINDMNETTRKIVISLLLLAPILVKLAGLASTLYGSFTGLKEALVGLKAAIAGSTAAAVALGAAIGLAVVWTLDMLGVFSAVSEAGEAMGELLGEDLVDSILTLLSVLTLGLFPLIAAVGAAIVELVRGDISGAVDAFHDVMGVFGDAFGNVEDMIISGLQSLGEWFVNIFSGIGGFVLGFLDDLGQGFMAFFLDTLPNLVLDGLIFLVSAVEVQLNVLFNLFASVFNGIIGLISEAIDTAVNGVIDIVNGFLEGIDEVANAVSDVTGRDIGDIESIGQVDTSGIAEDLQLQQRETGFSQVRQGNRQQAQGVQRQINNTEVNVDVGGDLQQNPHSFSRDVAEQVNREKRSNNGA
jgi:hypothetical protein